MPVADNGAGADRDGCGAAPIVFGTTPALPSIAYMRDVAALDRQLDLALSGPIIRGMRLTPEPDTLVEVGYDVRGRSVRMAPHAWRPSRG